MPTLTAVPEGATHRLVGVDVRYISLAGLPKNGRGLILKSDLGEGDVIVTREARIAKADAARQMAYGVVYAPDGVDADGHTMDAGEIEKAMLAFMAKGRVGAVDTDHDEQTGGAYVAESWLVKGTEAGETLDALFPGEAVGTWCVGIKVEDGATWDRIETGEITGLSFAGVAGLEPVAKAEPVEADRTDRTDDDIEKAAPDAGLTGTSRRRGEDGCTCSPTPDLPDRPAPTQNVEPEDGIEKARRYDRNTRAAVQGLTDGGPLAGADLRFDAIQAAMTAVVAPLVARLEALEKQTPGRQSAVGAEVPTQKARVRGLRITGA